MIEILKSILFGIVQGITEWLPVSSTGHMLLLDEFMTLDVGANCRELFFVLVQLGSVLAVIVLFFNELWPSSRKKWTLWLKIAIASIPAGVLGLLFEDYITEKLYGTVTICIALIVYGVLFVVIERVKQKKGTKHKVNRIDDISFFKAFQMGCFQALALIPGTSRSGSTILGGMLCSVSRPVAAKFSFFMAIPIMVGTSGYKLLKCGFAYNALEIWVLAAGTVTAFLVSLLVIKGLMSFVRSHSFEVFGWYRIALSIVVLIVWLLNR